jgi:putative oxidoreductase
MKTTLSKILNTQDDTAMLVIRLLLGAVMFPHGAQKLLGWFGGYGFSGTMGFFTGTMGIPWIFALAAILAESLGSIALILGLGTRIAAAAIATNMIVAVLTSHLQSGFFMNWFGNQKGEGFEYHLLALGLAAALMIKGGGKASIDLGLTGAPSADRKTPVFRSI